MRLQVFARASERCCHMWARKCGRAPPQAPSGRPPASRTGATLLNSERPVIMKNTDVPPVQKVIFPHPRKSQEVLPLLIQVHRYASPTIAHHFEARTGQQGFLSRYSAGLSHLLFRFNSLAYCSAGLALIATDWAAPNKESARLNGEGFEFFSTRFVGFPSCSKSHTIQGMNQHRLQNDFHVSAKLKSSSSSRENIQLLHVPCWWWNHIFPTGMLHFELQSFWFQVFVEIFGNRFGGRTRSWAAH